MKDPFIAHRFLVTLDPGDAYLPPAQARLVIYIAAGGFQEVTGLAGELEITPYAEGGNNDFVHQLPVRHSWGQMVLKRGLIRGPGLWEWYRAGLSQSLGARRDGAVLLFDTAGFPTAAWTFRGGLAAKWGGPDFNANTPAVAMESLTIAHHGLDQTFIGGSS